MNALLINPFRRYDARVLLPIGLAATAAGSLLAVVFGVRYDGVLDMHAAASVTF